MTFYCVLILCLLMGQQLGKLGFHTISNALRTTSGMIFCMSFHWLGTLRYELLCPILEDLIETTAHALQNMPVE